MNARLCFLIAITLAGCGDDNVGPLPDMAAPDLAIHCAASTCATCASGTTCVHASDVSASCLKPCSDQRDCPSGGECVIFRENAPATDRYCVAKNAPAACVGCAVAGPERCEGDVAVHGNTLGEYCATAYEYCPHGCNDAIDGGLAVRCNP